MVTNYIVQSTNVKFTERFILPDFRTHMYEVQRKEEELGYEPLIVIGEDGKWWNDELEFILDRMSDGNCCKGDELYDWAKRIQESPLKDGEVREYIYNGQTYSVKADTTDVSHGGRMTNDCEPIE